MQVRSAALPAAAMQRAPHILLLLADDYPWELYPRQNTPARSLLPHMSRLLSDEGLTLERHYAYSLCAPARASLLTGRWPHRAYETSSMRACKGVSPGMSTIAERLKEGANYATHFVGCVLLFYSPICLCSDLRSPVCAYTQQMARRLRHQLVHAVDARLRLVVWILRLGCRLQHKMLIQGGAIASEASER